VRASGGGGQNRPDTTETARTPLGRAPLNAQLARLAARQHGVVTAAQLAKLGVGSSAVTKRIWTGALHRVHRGVYAVGHPRLEARGLWMAAVLASGKGAALAGLSAAALWRISRWTPDEIFVIVPGDRGRQADFRAEMPPPRLARRHTPARHSGHDRGSNPRRSDRDPGRTKTRQPDPRGGVPKALRRAGDAGRDGSRQRAHAARAARAGAGAQRARQRRDQKRAGGSVPRARARGRVARARDQRRGRRDRGRRALARPDRRDRRPGSRTTANARRRRGTRCEAPSRRLRHRACHADRARLPRWPQ
jgi:hypothetical protein